MTFHSDVARLAVQSWVAFALEELEVDLSHCQDPNTFSKCLEEIIENVINQHRHALTVNENSFWDTLDVRPEVLAEYSTRFCGDSSWIWNVISEDAIRVATLDAMINLRQHEYQYLDWSDFYDPLYDDIVEGSETGIVRRKAQSIMLGMRTPVFLRIFHERRRIFETYSCRANNQTTVSFTGARSVGFTIRVDDEFERRIEPDSARFIRRDENGLEIYSANHLGRGGSNGWVTGNDAQPDFRMVLNADEHGEYLFEICLSWELLDCCGAIEFQETESEARIRFTEPPGSPAGETNEWIFDTSPRRAEDWFVPALFD
ncbi:hypothetical protein K491DRAFT_694142 [Lophiostoma macrostomum CBS 122681]|uniref:Uncharacterized protein n=1 Tax=Lophiostoma macrostomum CBS 122681 TaxID=1314788 RepID=A0A6A6T2T0_9PLEO|nr:hypothetical protein K491DRAFT_694142 [Lophiostoma macrostomum CBS 122681]